MRIKHLKNSNVKGYLVLTVEYGSGVESFSVSEHQYQKLGSPLVGDELSEEQYRSLSELDERNRAVRKALGILSFGDNSRASLFAKLRRAGYSSRISGEVADEMIGLGYIDEERQLKRLIENEVNQRLTGPRKFTQKLYAKGYPVSKIRALTEDLIQSGAIDLDKARRILIEKHSPNSEEEVRALLYKHGF